MFYYLNICIYLIVGMLERLKIPIITAHAEYMVDEEEAI